MGGIFGLQSFARSISFFYNILNLQMFIVGSEGMIKTSYEFLKVAVNI